MRWMLSVIFICLGLASATGVRAQSTTLRIVLLDEADRPVSLTITVSDAHGTVLATGIPDATGVFVVPTLRADQIWLTFAGTSPAGMPIRQEGPHGMPISLTEGTTSLFLRTLDEGFVIPDPSEILLEGGTTRLSPTAPGDAIATAMAAPAPLPAVLVASSTPPQPRPRPTPHAVVPTSVNAAPVQSATPPHPTALVALLIALVGGIGGVLMLRGRI